LILLRRLSLEQVNLEPANLVSEGESLQRILAAMADGDHTHFVAINSTGNYAGMLCEADLHAALLEPDAIPLLLVRDVMRGDLAPVFTTDDLASVMDRFAATEAEYLPVAVQSNKNKIIGVVSRTSLMRRYRTAVIEET
jgi:CBS domain-containing protein